METIGEIAADELVGSSGRRSDDISRLESEEDKGEGEDSWETGEDVVVGGEARTSSDTENLDEVCFDGGAILEVGIGEGNFLVEVGNGPPAACS